MQSHPNSAIWAGESLPEQRAAQKHPSHFPYLLKEEVSRGKKAVACGEPLCWVLSHTHSVGFGAGVGPVLVLTVGNLAMCPWEFFLLCGQQAWLSHFPSESSAIFKTITTKKHQTKPTLSCLNSPQLVSSAGNYKLIPSPSLVRLPGRGFRGEELCFPFSV